MQVLWAGLGMLVASAYGGYALSLDHTPYWAGASVVAFLLVIALPYLSEYSAVDRGFKFTEDDFQTEERKLLEQAGKPEVFAPEERRGGESAWRRHGLSGLGYKLLLSLGFILFGVDIASLVLS